MFPLGPNILEKEIDACAAFIVVMTPRSKESEWVQDELLWARKRGKRIVPLLLEGDDWLTVSGTNYEKVRGGRLPSEAFYEGLRKLSPPPRVDEDLLTSGGQHQV